LPHDSDWDDIASLTGDSSWRASRMRRYARDLETCYHRPVWRALRCPGIDWTGHGWDGWLRTEKSIPLDALGDADLRRVVRGTVRAFTPQPPRAAHECAALASRCRGSERTDVGAWQL
ncbi:MAG: GMC family oxidoreductase, partial [Casimicrobiaceae bacterium]